MLRNKSNYPEPVKQKKNVSALKKTVRFIFRLIVVAALLLLLKNGEALFRINEIRVEGQVEISPAAIVAAAGINEGASMFMLHSQKISEQIREELPRVKSAAINRNLPDEVLITVTEREPVASFATEKGFWLIDEDVFCLDFALKPYDDYPMILGVDEQLIVPGALLNCPVRKEALADFFKIWPSGTELEIAAIELSDKYNLIVHTVEGMEIWLGDGKDLVSKLHLIQQSIPHIQSDSEIYLDARSGKRLVVSKNALNGEKEVDP